MKNPLHLFRNFSFILFLLLVGTELSGQFYYGLRQEFGKNRVQFTEFDWVFYRFERFDVYFYRGNDDLAARVAQMTDEELPRIESLLDAPLDDRIQLLVFNNLSDLKQSNVNSSSDEDYNNTGVTSISGRRLFLYFNGDFMDLRNDLRARLVEAVLSNLIYGNFTQSIRNSALLNLPEWYVEGLISYISRPDDVLIENRIMDAYERGQFRNINSLVGSDARMAGHSLWTYVAETYGQKVLKNVVYMAIVNRNIESGFLYILGKDLEAIEEDWKDYLKRKYQPNTRREAFPEDELIKAPKKYRMTHMATSPDGRYMAYVRQKFSRYKVYIYDFEKKKKKRILTEGYRIAQNADYSYPLLSWHPEGNILAMMTEEKGFTYLSFYNVEDKEWERKKFFRFDKILSFEYSADGRRFVISATKDGQSDIFIYTILNTKIDQLTNDTYNDLHPTWIDNDKRVAWSSNRTTDTLKKGEDVINFPRKTHDLFAMEAAVPEDTAVVWRMTNSPKVDEIRPVEYAPGYVAFLSSREQVQSRHLVQIDSSITFVDTTTHYDYTFKEYTVTEYKRSLLDHAYLPERGKNIDMVYYDGRYRIYDTEYRSPEDMQLRAVEETDAVGRSFLVPVQRDSVYSGPASRLPLYYPGVDPAEFEVDIYNYRFEEAEEGTGRGRRSQPRQKPVPILPMPDTTVEEGVAEAAEDDTLEIPPQRNYFLSFYRDEFNVRFDNMFDNPQYQRFTGFVSGDLLNAGFNMQFKVGVMDLMHDYRIIGGMRTNFQPLTGTSIAPNATFLLGVGDYKDRLDKEYTYTRMSQVTVTTLNEYQRIITNQVMGQVRWPFNPVASIRGSLGYRGDQTLKLSRDVLSLEDPPVFQHYAIGKLAYVYDNSRKIGVNLYAGLRAKVFTEYYRNVQESNAGMHTAGVDLRHYTVIHRNLIWANRFAAGTSFGPQKLIHIMGGVDNAFAPRFEPTTPIATENNYIFQTLVTNMRGFYQNARNGNSFSLINSEIRWPIFSYLFRKPIRSDFIKNFMIIGFGDIGTAWNGVSPYDRENAINTRTIDRNNLVIVLDSQREPIIGSYGVGARTRLFGYYLRLDWAWPIENRIVLDSQWTFSIGYDF